MDPDELIEREQVRKLIREILRSGEVIFTPHAEEQLEERDLDRADCLSVLRGGWCEFEEFINGTWRYRIVTQKMCVVIAFDSEEALAIITVWRFS